MKPNSKRWRKEQKRERRIVDKLVKDVLRDIYKKSAMLDSQGDVEIAFNDLPLHEQQRQGMILGFGIKHGFIKASCKNWLKDLKFSKLKPYLVVDNGEKISSGRAIADFETRFSVRNGYA